MSDSAEHGGLKVFGPDGKRLELTNEGGGAGSLVIPDGVTAITFTLPLPSGTLPALGDLDHPSGTVSGHGVTAIPVTVQG